MSNFLVLLVLFSVHGVGGHENTSCPDSNWGAMCDQTCGHNCRKCARENGTCLSCAAGWFLSDLLPCYSECGPMTYGADCSGSCLQKCKRDCVDRVTGSCVHTAAASDPTSKLIAGLKSCVLVEITGWCVFELLALVAFGALELTCLWH
ncbi:hypothetical protein EGW08_002171, partial [Elysia chlorotica]